MIPPGNRPPAIDRPSGRNRRAESRLDAKIDGLDAKIDGLDVRMRRSCQTRVEHSQAKLEGLLEGLREAITGRAAAG